jgi:hypothetical protein
MDVAGPLVSFHLASNRPDNFVGLLDNLEAKTRDPQQVEILVKIDDEDAAMQAVVLEQAKTRPFAVKFICGPRGKGFEDIWMSYNKLLPLAHPEAYFFCLLNDELRVNQVGWDENLKRYVGLFPDHIFRLRTTHLRLRNYFDFWECGYAPDSYAFITQRWFAVSGDWNPCAGPDTCQQFIAYHLWRSGHPAHGQINRDVPIFDVSFAGEGSSQGMTEAQRVRRNTIHFRQWYILVSHRIQIELRRRARLLEAAIIAAAQPQRRLEAIDDAARRCIKVVDAESGRVDRILPYRIGRLGLFLANAKRTLHYHYYCGGGERSWIALPFSLIEFAVVYYPRLRPWLGWLCDSKPYWITKEITSLLSWSLRQRQPGLFRQLIDDFADRNLYWDRNHPIMARVVRGLLAVNPY